MVLALATAAAVLGIAAIYSDRGGTRRAAFYVLKPLTTILIIGIALLRDPAHANYQQWMVIGLVLSLAGDIALMFHGNRWFMAGLASFFLAHQAFIAGFLLGLPALNPPWWSAASLLAGIAFLPLIWDGAGKLRPAVAAYGLVLVAMVIAAATRYAALPGAPALLAVVGAGLFQVSDSTLAYRKFVRPFPGGQAVVLSTYWLAIGLVAWSI